MFGRKSTQSRAKGLVLELAALREREFDSLLRILDEILDRSLPLRLNTRNDPADIVLKGFQLFIAMDSIAASNCLSEAEKTGMWGELSSSFLSSNTEAVTAHYLKFMELIGDEIKQVEYAATCLCNCIASKSEQTAIAIISNLLTIFSLKTEESVANGLSDKESARTIRHRIESVWPTVSYFLRSIDENRLSYCGNCYAKTQKSAIRCHECQSRLMRMQRPTPEEPLRNTAPTNRATFARTNLPRLGVRPAEICEQGLDWTRQIISPAYLGTTAVFNIKELRAASLAKRQNLDDFLSFHLALGFTGKRNLRPILVWFELRQMSREQDFIALTFSSKSRINLDWLGTIPGFLERGDEAVKPTARPYALWDAQNLHRLHLIDPGIDHTRQLATDFFPPEGMLVGTTSPEAAQRIGRRDPDCWEYSLVPDEHEQILNLDGKRVVLLHSAAIIQP